jgi:hypothetical protein
VGQRLPAHRRLVPHSREALRAVRRRTGARSPQHARRHRGAYGFDLGALDPIAARAGPTVSEIAEPLDAFPADSTCNAFDPDAIVRTW